MLYLLDADTIITGDRDPYPLRRFPIFWEWLLQMGSDGIVKIPLEQYEEITKGRGVIVDWCKTAEAKGTLVLAEEALPASVARITVEGYAADLTEDEVEQIGRDPFLIAYGLVSKLERTVVTFENSKPTRQRANKKIPDVCAAFAIGRASCRERV